LISLGTPMIIVGSRFSAGKPESAEDCVFPR
jgi:hypothetical protein